MGSSFKMPVRPAGEGLRVRAAERRVTLVAYWMYRDPQGMWRWRLLAANNRNIANSGEGYHNESDCLQAIQLVKGSSVASVYKQ